MSVTFTATDNSVTFKALDLVNSAMTELGLKSPEETLSTNDQNWGLEKLQRIIDRWNAARPTVFNVTFQKYTLLANTQPITIGPGGHTPAPQFAMPNGQARPVKIVAASVVLTSSTPNVDAPFLKIRDDAWWAANRVKGLTSTLPTDLYYSPDNPLGNLYFWPIPTVANDVRLEMWTALAQVIDINTTSYGAPPGYWDALVMSLADALIPSYGTAVSPETAVMVRSAKAQAMKTIEANNMKSPRIATVAPGQKCRVGNRADFNWMTGEVVR